MSPSRGALVAGAALTAAAAVTITVVVWPDVSDTGRQGDGRGQYAVAHVPFADP